MAPWTFDVKFSYGTQFTFGALTFAVGEEGNLQMLPQGQHQSTLCQHMDKLHIFWSSHLLHAVLAQVWILMRGSISAPSSLFGVFRS
jgi:hypothetical protein